MDLRVFADYHTHTRYSHGSGSVDDNVVAACHKGLEVVAITDHGPANLFGVGVSSLAVFDDIFRDAARANERWGDIKVLVGVEANIIDIDGRLDVPPEWLAKFDVVQAGLHLLVRPGSLRSCLLFAGDYLSQPFPRLRGYLRDVNTQAVINAVLRNPIDIITHPGLRVDIDTVALAKVCVEKGTALEINTSHHHITVEYIKAAAKTGVDFVIGSDAHSPDRVGDFARGIALAEAAGLPASRIRNAHP